jgi:hypothetical protein
MNLLSIKIEHNIRTNEVYKIVYIGEKLTFVASVTIPDATLSPCDLLDK